MGAYRRLVKDLIAAGGKAGVDLHLLKRLERAQPPVLHLAATEPLLAVARVSAQAEGPARAGVYAKAASLSSG